MYGAKELKEISINANFEKADVFWDDYKEILGEKLYSIAKGGGTSFRIAQSHMLLNKDNMMSTPYLYKRVIKELELLGYSVSHSDDNRDGTYMHISW